MTLIRLPSVGYFVGLFNTFPIGNISFTLMCYCGGIQFLVHAAIAFDRYRVISDSDKKVRFPENYVTKTY